MSSKAAFKFAILLALAVAGLTMLRLVAYGQVQIEATAGGNVQIGGGGGIVPPNPSTTAYVVYGDSRDLSSTSNAITITVTSVNCNGVACIMTAANSLKAGDWIGLNISSPAFLVGLNPYIFQVLSTGLSSSQFEFAYTANTGTGTGGTVIYETYLWPQIMANLPYFAGHGTVYNLNPPGAERLSDFISNYTTLVHPFAPSVTGYPGYVFNLSGYADLVFDDLCAVSALPTIEGQMQTLMALEHADGFKVVEVTNPFNTTYSFCGTATSYLAFSNLNTWMKAQGQTGPVAETTGTASSSSTTLTVASGTGIAINQGVTGTNIAAGTYVTNVVGTTVTLSTATTGALSTTPVVFAAQYWDFMVDAASEINMTSTNTQWGLFTQVGNIPHFTDAGHQLLGQLANATLLNNLQLKNDCDNGNNCPNMTHTNIFVSPDPASSGQSQILSLPYTTGGFHGQQGEWLTIGTTSGGAPNTCIGTGFGTTNSVGDPAVLSGSSGCGGSNLYSQLSFRPGSFIYLGSGEAYGWSSSGGQNATIDTRISRDAAGVVDFDTTTTHDKAGAANMAWIALGTAHVAGHSFDCSGTNCPGSGGGGLNGTVTYTSSQTAASGDNGKLVIMNCSGACAYTLPATQPSTTWQIALQSVGSTTATVGLSGDTYNGGASAPVLPNYYTLPIWANSTTSTDYRGGTPPVASTNMTITPAANGQAYSATGGSTTVSTFSCADTSGSGTAQSCTAVPTLSSLTVNTCIAYTTTTSNTGALTLNVSALGAKSVVKWQGTALVSGDLGANKSTQLCYDGTNWDAQDIGNAPSGGGATKLLDTPFDAVPGSPSAWDDEFTGEVSLPVKWTSHLQGSGTATFMNAQTLVGYQPVAGGGDVISAITQSAPGSTPWTITTKLKLIVPNENFHYAGPIITDTSNNVISFKQQTTVGYQVCLGSGFPTSSTFCQTSLNGGSFAGLPVPSGVTWIYLRIADDGTNFSFLYSYDGQNFTSLYSEAVGTHLTTLSTIGLVWGNNNTTSSTTAVFGWFR